MSEKWGIKLETESRKEVTKMLILMLTKLIVVLQQLKYSKLVSNYNFFLTSIDLMSKMQ